MKPKARPGAVPKAPRHGQKYPRAGQKRGAPAGPKLPETRAAMTCREAGRRGGEAVARERGADHYRELSERGLKVRLAKNPDGLALPRYRFSIRRDQYRDLARIAAAAGRSQASLLRELLDERLPELVAGPRKKPTKDAASAKSTLT